MESKDIKKEAGENDCSHIIRQNPTTSKAFSFFITVIMDNSSIAAFCPLSGVLTWFMGNINTLPKCC